MARRFDSARLQAISQLPSEGSADCLVKAEDSVVFLKANAQGDDVVIYATEPTVLIHAVLVPLQ